MNPCPCGYLGSTGHYCTCTKKQIAAYRNRLSGPVYDRMDILLPLTSAQLDQMSGGQEPSSAILERVKYARNRQYARYQKEISNARVPYELLVETSPLSEGQRKMLHHMSIKQHWSNRVQIKMIRLARTISDLTGAEEITDEALWEAMTLRRINGKQQSTAVKGM